MGYTEYMKNWRQHMGDLDSESENGPQNQHRFDDQSMNAVSE